MHARSTEPDSQNPVRRLSEPVMTVVMYNSVLRHDAVFFKVTSRKRTAAPNHDMPASDLTAAVVNGKVWDGTVTVYAC